MGTWEGEGSENTSRSAGITHLEGGVTFGADLVLGISLIINQVAEAMEHYLVTPAELPANKSVMEIRGRMICMLGGEL